LKFFYQKKDDIYYINVPNYRLDIANAEDLLEELLRIYDYNKVFSYAVSELKSTSFGINKYDLKIKNLRTYLANCG
jgi:phenylalanyl-tRNA synthetase beta subunit